MHVSLCQFTTRSGIQALHSPRPKVIGQAGWIFQLLHLPPGSLASFGQVSETYVPITALTPRGRCHSGIVAGWIYLDWCADLGLWGMHQYMAWE